EGEETRWHGQIRTTGGFSHRERERFILRTSQQRPRADGADECMRPSSLGGARTSAPAIPLPDRLCWHKGCTLPSIAITRNGVMHCGARSRAHEARQETVSKEPTGGKPCIERMRAEYLRTYANTSSLRSVIDRIANDMRQRLLHGV